VSWLGNWLGGALGRWFGYVVEEEDEDVVPVAEGGHNHKRRSRADREQEALAYVLALKMIQERKEAARRAIEEDDAELAEMAGIYMAWRRNEQPVEVS